MNSARTPAIQNFEKALFIYYSKYELRTKDILELFGNIGSATATRLKRQAKEYAKANGVQEINAASVDTKAAFRAWGIDIKDIESRYHKLKNLGLYSQDEAS